MESPPDSDSTSSFRRPRLPLRKTDEERLRTRLLLIAGLGLIVTAILLADPLRLFPDNHASDTLIGLLLGSGLVALGVKGLEGLIKK